MAKWIRSFALVPVLLCLTASGTTVAGTKSAAYKSGEVIDTTVAKAQKLLPFTILEPTTLPATLRLTKVTVGYPAVADARQAVDVTLVYTHEHPPLMVMIVETEGHQPPGLPKLHGIPYTEQAAPKGVPAPSALALYFGSTVCSFSSLMPMASLKRIAVSMRPLKKVTGKDG